MENTKPAPELEYVAPELFELGSVEEMTFGPSPNNTNDHHTIQYDGSTVPAIDSEFE